MKIKSIAVVCHSNQVFLRVMVVEPVYLYGKVSRTVIHTLAYRVGRNLAIVVAKTFLNHFIHPTYRRTREAD
jgi:hypothetical protein